MNKPIYKSTGKRGLFDKEDTVYQLSSIGNPLENPCTLRHKGRLNAITGLLNR